MRSALNFGDRIVFSVHGSSVQLDLKRGKSVTNPLNKGLLVLARGSDEGTVQSRGGDQTVMSTDVGRCEYDANTTVTCQDTSARAENKERKLEQSFAREPSSQNETSEEIIKCLEEREDKVVNLDTGRLTREMQGQSNETLPFIKSRDNSTACLTSLKSSVTTCDLSERQRRRDKMFLIDSDADPVKTNTQASCALDNISSQLITTTKFLPPSSEIQQRGVAEMDLQLSLAGGSKSSFQACKLERYLPSVEMSAEGTSSLFLNWTQTEEDRRGSIKEQTVPRTGENLALRLRDCRDGSDSRSEDSSKHENWGRKSYTYDSLSKGNSSPSQRQFNADDTPLSGRKRLGCMAFTMPRQENDSECVTKAVTNAQDVVFSTDQNRRLSNEENGCFSISPKELSSPEAEQAIFNSSESLQRASKPGGTSCERARGRGIWNPYSGGRQQEHVEFNVERTALCSTFQESGLGLQLEEVGRSIDNEVKGTLDILHHVTKNSASCRKETLLREGILVTSSSDLAASESESVSPVEFCLSEQEKDKSNLHVTSFEQEFLLKLTEDSSGQTKHDCSTEMHQAASEEQKSQPVKISMEVSTTNSEKSTESQWRQRCSPSIMDTDCTQMSRGDSRSDNDSPSSYVYSVNSRRKHQLHSEDSPKSYSRSDDTQTGLNHPDGTSESPNYADNSPKIHSLSEDISVRHSNSYGIPGGGWPSKESLNHCCCGDSRGRQCESEDSTCHGHKRRSLSVDNTSVNGSPERRHRSDNSPIKYPRSKDSARGRSPFEESPTRQSHSKDSPRRHGHSEHSPRRQYRSKESPRRRSNSGESPSRHSCSYERRRRHSRSDSESPDRYSRSVRNPRRQSHSEESLRRHFSSDESPRKHSRSKESPGRHSRSKESPRRHPRSEDKPRRQSRSAKSPTRHSRSTESPRKHSRSRESPTRNFQSRESPRKHSRSRESPRKHSRSRESPVRHSRSEENPTRHSPSKESLRRQCRSEESLRKHSRAKDSPTRHSRSDENPTRHSRSKESPTRQSCSEESPRKHFRSKDSPRKHSRPENSPRRQSRSEENPRRRSRSKESPRKHSRSEDSPRRRSRSEENPRRRFRSEESPRKHSRLEESPSRHSRSEESPRKHSRLEESPRKHSRLEESPRKHSRLEESPSRHCRSEESPRKQSRSEESPRKHSRSDDTPGKHYMTEDSPIKHSRSEDSPRRKHSQSKESPRRHFRSEERPTKHSQSEDRPRRHSRSEESPRKHSQSKESPRKHSRSNDSLRKHYRSEDSPRRQSRTEDSARRHSYSEGNPRRHSRSRSKESPRKHSRFEESPRRQSCSEENPRKNNRSENSPRRHSRSRSKESPRKHSRSEESPRRQSCSEENPRKNNRSENSPRRHSRSRSKENPRKHSRLEECPRRQSRSENSPRRFPSRSKDSPGRHSRSKESPRKHSRSNESPRRLSRSEESPRNKSHTFDKPRKHSDSDDSPTRRSCSDDSRRRLSSYVVIPKPQSRDKDVLRRQLEANGHPIRRPLSYNCSRTLPVYGAKRGRYSRSKFSPGKCSHPDTSTSQHQACALPRRGSEVSPRINCCGDSSLKRRFHSEESPRKRWYTDCHTRKRAHSEDSPRQCLLFDENAKRENDRQGAQDFCKKKAGTLCFLESTEENIESLPMSGGDEKGAIESEERGLLSKTENDSLRTSERRRLRSLESPAVENASSLEEVTKEERQTFHQGDTAVEGSGSSPKTERGDSPSRESLTSESARNVPAVGSKTQSSICGKSPKTQLSDVPSGNACAHQNIQRDENKSNSRKSLGKERSPKVQSLKEKETGDRSVAGDRRNLSCDNKERRESPKRQLSVARSTGSERTQRNTDCSQRDAAGPITSDRRSRNEIERQRDANYRRQLRNLPFSLSWRDKSSRWCVGRNVARRGGNNSRISANSRANSSLLRRKRLTNRFDDDECDEDNKCQRYDDEEAMPYQGYVDSQVQSLFAFLGKDFVTKMDSCHAVEDGASDVRRQWFPSVEEWTSYGNKESKSVLDKGKEDVTCQELIWNKVPVWGGEEEKPPKEINSSEDKNPDLQQSQTKDQISPQYPPNIRYFQDFDVTFCSPSSRSFTVSAVQEQRDDERVLRDSTRLALGVVTSGAVESRMQYVITTATRCHLSSPCLEDAPLTDIDSSLEKERTQNTLQSKEDAISSFTPKCDSEKSFDLAESFSDFETDSSSFASSPDASLTLVESSSMESYKTEQQRPFLLLSDSDTRNDATSSITKYPAEHSNGFRNDKIKETTQAGNGLPHGAVKRAVVSSSIGHPTVVEPMPKKQKKNLALQSPPIKSQTLEAKDLNSDISAPLSSPVFVPLRRRSAGSFTETRLANEINSDITSTKQSSTTPNENKGDCFSVSGNTSEEKVFNSNDQQRKKSSDERNAFDKGKISECFFLENNKSESNKLISSKREKCPNLNEPLETVFGDKSRECTTKRRSSKEGVGRSSPRVRVDEEEDNFVRRKSTKERSLKQGSYHENSKPNKLNKKLGMATRISRVDAAQPSTNLQTTASQQTGQNPRYLIQQTGHNPWNPLQQTGQNPWNPLQQTGQNPREPIQQMGQNPWNAIQQTGHNPRDTIQKTGQSPRDSITTSGILPTFGGPIVPVDYSYTGTFYPNGNNYKMWAGTGYLSQQTTAAFARDTHNSQHYALAPSGASTYLSTWQGNNPSGFYGSNVPIHSPSDKVAVDGSYWAQPISDPQHVPLSGQYRGYNNVDCTNPGYFYCPDRPVDNWHTPNWAEFNHIPGAPRLTAFPDKNLARSNTGKFLPRLPVSPKLTRAQLP